jgi:predicted alpha/beta hydrolase
VVEVKYLSFLADDGVELKASLFKPDAGVSNTFKGQDISVLINSATGAPRFYYERFASFLAEQGFMVLTYDYRGLFDSSQTPELDAVASMRDWGELDTEAALKFLLDKNPDAKLTFVGHSIGGTLLGLAQSNGLVKTAIAIATPSGHWRHWPFPEKLFSYFAYTIFVPLVVAIRGKLPSRYVGTELPRGVALEWARWCKHEDFVVDQKGNALHDGFTRYKGPYLFYATTDDIFAPPDAVKALAALFKNARLEFKIVRPADWQTKSIGHFGFFRKTAPVAFWQELADYLRETE